MRYAECSGRDVYVYCIVLYCIVLYCTVLYCIVLYCIVLYCIVLYCIVLYCIVLRFSEFFFRYSGIKHEGIGGYSAAWLWLISRRLIRLLKKQFFSMRLFFRNLFSFPLSYVYFLFLLFISNIITFLCFLFPPSHTAIECHVFCVWNCASTDPYCFMAWV